MRYGGLTVGKVDLVRVDPGNSTRIEIGLVVNKEAPIKTDSVAKISALGPLTDNYIEVSTGTQNAALAPPGSTLLSAEAFGLPQLGEAAQALVPDVQKALQTLNHNLDDLQVTLARANDLLNDRNRANIGESLGNLNHLVADARPKVTESLNHLNGMLDDAQPKISASLTNVQAILPPNCHRCSMTSKRRRPAPTIRWLTWTPRYSKIAPTFERPSPSCGIRWRSLRRCSAN